MPDFRTDLLPAGDWLYNSFFDPVVQNILEGKRSAPPKCPKQFRVFLLAWPILVFEISGELSSEHSDIERHSDWLHCYHLDRQFSADLLASVTRFIKLPQEEWDLRRALVEFANSASHEAVEFRRTCYDGVSSKPPRSGLMTWKNVASQIEANCPHLKSVWLSGERLRKKEFYAEKKRREAIMKRWQPNFTAFQSYGRTKWHERMPCLPC